MPERRFPPPWTVEEYRGISYIVRDANRFAVAYVYFESETGRRAAANLMTKRRSEEDCGRHRQTARPFIEAHRKIKSRLNGGGNG